MEISSCAEAANLTFDVFPCCWTKKARGAFFSPRPKFPGIEVLICCDRTGCANKQNLFFMLWKKKQSSCVFFVCVLCIFSVVEIIAERRLDTCAAMTSWHQKFNVITYGASPSTNFRLLVCTALGSIIGLIREHFPSCKINQRLRSGL